MTIEDAESDVNIHQPAIFGQASAPLGGATLAGEIIDPKCYFGAMKPGEGKIHKACATLCLRGGIPPMFMTTDEQGRHVYYLLTKPDGRGSNHDKLQRVPVSGEVNVMSSR